MVSVTLPHSPFAAASPATSLVSLAQVPFSLSLSVPSSTSLALNAVVAMLRSPTLPAGLQH